MIEKTVRKLMLLAGMSLLGGGCMQSKLAYDKEMPQARELAVLLGKEFEADGAIPITAEEADILVGYLELKAEERQKEQAFWIRSRIMQQNRMNFPPYNQQIRSYHTQRR